MSSEAHGNGWCEKCQAYTMELQPDGRWHCSHCSEYHHGPYFPLRTDETVVRDHSQYDIPGWLE